MVCEMHVTFSEGTNKLWSPLKWNATVPGLYCQPEEVQLNTWKEERHDGLCSPMGWQVFEFYRSDMVQKQRTWGQASLNSNRATGLPLPFESTDRKGKKNLFYWWTIKWVWQFHKALKWSRYVSFVIGPLDFSSSEGRNTRRKKTQHNGSLKRLATQVSGAAATAFYVLLLHHTTLHLRTDQ